MSRRISLSPVLVIFALSLIYSAQTAFAATSADFTIPAGWSMVSVPLAPSGGASDCASFGGTAFALANGQYIQCGSLYPPAPGRGFIVHEGAPLAVHLTGSAPDPNAPFQISLQPGWNLIGNPFSSPVALNQLSVDGVPFTQTDAVVPTLYKLGDTPDTYAPADTLDPYKAVLVNAKRAAILRISICSGTQCVLVPQPNEQDQNLYAAPFAAGSPIASSPGGKPFVDGQALLTFVPGITRDAAVQFITSTGAQLIGANVRTGIYQVAPPAGASPAQYMASLSGAPLVQSASLNYLAGIAGIPNEPIYAPAAQDSSRWAFTKIGMTDVWKEFTPVAQPVLAIIDTGVDGSHPEFAGRMLPGRNFLTPATPDNASDDNGHGTAMAGIAAARGDNGAGISGVCWNCRIMPVKACDAAGRCPMFAVLNAITWAAANGADVINLSLGADLPSDPQAAAAFHTVLMNAAYGGKTVIAAAGNGASDASGFLPGADPAAFSVAATTPSDSRAQTSNYGPSVDIAAPGENVYTTALNGGYATLSGTSAAAAMVSGLTGLALSIYPGLAPSDLKLFISSSADSISTDYPVGKRINASALFHVLANGNLPPAVLSITPDMPYAETYRTMRIVARATDPENHPMTYVWSTDAGSITASGPIAVWSTPHLPGAAKITLTVKDNLLAPSQPSSITIPVLDDTLTSIRVQPRNPTIVQGTAIGFITYAYDFYSEKGTAAPVSITPQWTIDRPDLATINPDGTLVGLLPGVAVLSVGFGGKSDAITITITPPGQNPAYLATAADTTACLLDWPRFKCNNAGTSVYAENTAAPYVARWNSAMPFFIHASPIARDGKLYIVDGQANVRKVDMASGGTDWQDLSVNEAVDYSPALEGNNLYFETYYGHIYRYDILAGPGSKSLFYSTINAPIDSIYTSVTSTIIGGKNILYFGTNRLYAVEDPGTGAAGTLKWMYPPLVTQNLGLVRSNPTVVDIGASRVVLFGANNRNLYALDATTGAPLPWSPIFLDTPLQCPPVYSANFGGRIYILNNAGDLFAINPATGARIWKRPGVRATDMAPLSADGDMLYFGDTPGFINAVRDLGAAWDDTVWAASPNIGTNILAPVTVSGNELFAAPFSNGTLTVIDRPTGAVKWRTPLAYGGIVGGIIIAKRHPAPLEFEIYTAYDNGGVIALSRNYPPQITLLETAVPAPPAGLPPTLVAANLATIHAAVTDANGISDLVATMSIDLTAIGGPANEILYDNGTHGDPVVRDGNYYNNSIWVRAGTASGPQPLYATAADVNGLTGTGTYGFLVAEAPPSIISASFSPTFVQAGGIATTTLNVTIYDLNHQITAVEVDTNPINGPAGQQWAGLACGPFNAAHQSICTNNAITANGATPLSPPNLTLDIRARDTVFTATTTVQLEIVGLNRLTMSATSPSAAGANSSVNIKAYDKYGNIFTAFNNTAPINLTTSGFASAATLTWSGPGVTNSPGTGSATLASGRFSAGSATVFITDTKAETGTLMAVEQDTGLALSATATATWIHGALARLQIRIAPNNGGYVVAAYLMDVGQTLPLWCAGYDAFMNYIADQPCSWSVTGTLTPPPAPGLYPNFNYTPDHGQLSGTAAGTVPGVATATTGIITVRSFRPNPTTLSAANASGAVRLVWSAVTTYNDGGLLDPTTVKYEIYRSGTSGGPASDPYALKFTSASGTLTATDAAVTFYTPYYYVAVAIDPQGRRSGYSNVAGVIPVPAPFVYKQTCGDQTTGSFLPASTPGFFNRPASVTTDAADNIYVADMYNNRIQKFDRNCHFIWARGLYGSSNGNFKLPSGIVYSPSNSSLYVADYYNRVQVFDAGTGAFKSAFPVTMPNSLAVDAGGNVYVTTGVGTLVKTTPAGAQIMTITGLGSPRGVAIAPDSSIFFVDNTRSKIVKYSPAGAKLSEFGAYGSGFSSFISPNGLCVDPGGNLYVSDSFNDRIQVFSPTGSLINIVGATGANYGQLRRPTGAAINSAGNLITADNYNNRVQEFQKP